MIRTRASRALAAGALALLLGGLGIGPATAAASSSSQPSGRSSSEPSTGSGSSAGDSSAGDSSAGESSTGGSGGAAESALGVATSSSGVALDLLATSGATLTPESEFSVDLRVTGLDVATQSTATVRIYASSTPLTTESAVQSWADGRGQVRGDVALLEQPLVAPDTTTPQGRFSVPAGSMPSLGRTWGPRGITVEVVDAASQRLASQRSFVVWLPDGAPEERAGVAVLVPLSAGAPDLGTGEVPTATLAALTADGGRLDRVLRAASGAGVAWALDPAVLGRDPAVDAAPEPTDTSATTPPTSAGTTGPDDPAAADQDGARAAWVERVADGSRDREVVALPRTDPDLDALGAARADPLYTLAEQQTRTAVADLIGGTARTDLAWPATGVPTAEGWGVAATGGRTALVVDRTATAPTRADPEDAATTGARVEVEARGVATAPGLVPDVAASRALTEGAAVGGGAALTGARLLAESALVALGDDEPDAAGAVPMLITTPRTWDADPDVAGQVLAALDAAPWVTPTTLTTLLEAPSSGTVTLPSEGDGTGDGGTAAGGDTGAGPLPTAGIDQVADAQERARATSVALTDPAALLDGVERSAVAATSSWWRPDTSTWLSGVSALTTASGVVDGGVRVLRGSSVNVLSSEVALPVTVSNELDQDVTVRVSLRSTTARLQPDQEFQEVTVAAQRQQLVQLPVTAVASGDTVLTVLLSTTDGATIGVPQMLQVRVRADWEGRGIAVGAILVVLVLLVGIVRTIRRHRRHPRRATSLGVDLTGPRPDDPGPDDPGSDDPHEHDPHGHDRHHDDPDHDDSTPRGSNTTRWTG